MKSGKNSVISREVPGTYAVTHDGVNWSLTNSHQKLTAKGPTTSEYHVVLFFSTQDKSIDINVEYYTKLPAGPLLASPALVPDKYQWVSRATCRAGRGSAKGTCTKTRKVKCIKQMKPNNQSNKKSQIQVPDSYCDPNKKPSTFEKFQCPTGCSGK